MGIAKSLRKSGRLAFLAQGLKDVLNSLNQDNSLQEYLNMVTETKGNMQNRFQQANDYQNALSNTFNDPFLFGNETRRKTAVENLGRMPNISTEEANRQALGDIASFVMESLGKNVSPDVKQGALSGLDLFRQSMTPTVKKPGEIKAVNPNYDVYQDGKLIKEGDKKQTSLKPSDKFMGISEKGYWEVDYSDPASPQLKRVENPDYKPDSAGKDDGPPDPSSGLGLIEETQAKIDMIKKAEYDESSNSYIVSDPKVTGKYYTLTKKDVQDLIENTKNSIKQEMSVFLSDQGLNNATEDIRKILDKLKGKSKNRRKADLPKALDDFFEGNPELKDKRKILEKYFNLFLEQFNPSIDKLSDG